MTVFDQPDEHRHGHSGFLHPCTAIKSGTGCLPGTGSVLQVASSPKLNLQKIFFLFMLLSKFGIKLNIIQPLNNVNLQT